VAAILLAAGCSSSSSSGSGGTASASAAATSAAASAAGSAPDTTGASPVASAAGTDIGLTATTMKVGIIADVNNPLVPGLFQDSVNAVKAWAAGGYRVLPPSTVRFDSRYYKVEVAVGEVPARLLAPSEQPDERPILAHAQRIEGQLSEVEANAVYTWGHIMESLALNP